MFTVQEKEVLQSFSSSKIIKLFKRFQIDLSPDEIAELILSSHSVKEVTTHLLEEYKIPNLISDNLHRYVKKYWELNFKQYWSIERINDEIVANLSIEYAEDVFDIIDAFDITFTKIKQLENPNHLIELIENESDIETLKNWFFRYLWLIQNMLSPNIEIQKKFEELELFVIENFKLEEHPDLKNILMIVKSTVLFNIGFKDEALNLVNEMLTKDPKNIHLSFLKLKFMIGLYKGNTNQKLNSFLKELTNRINSPEDLTNLKQFLKTLIDNDLTVENVLNSTLHTVEHKLDKVITVKGSDHTIKNQKFNEELFERELNLASEQTFGEMIKQNLDDHLHSKRYMKTIERLLNGNQPLIFDFECISCGIYYSLEIDEIQIPFNLAELKKENKNNWDNGLIIFFNEIKCLFCSSFKFKLQSNSWLFIYGVMAYLIEKKENDEFFELENMLNRIKISDFISNHAKGTRTIFEAYKIITNRLKADSKNHQLLIAKGNISLRMNYYDEAKKNFNEVLSMNPLNIEALYNLLKIYRERNLRKQCIRLIRDLMVKIENKGSIIKENIEFFEGIYDILHDLNHRKLLKQYNKLIINLIS